VAGGPVRLVDRLRDRYRAQGYYEGMASGAAVLKSYGSDVNREGSVQQIVAAAQQAYTTNGVVFACELVRMMLLSEARFQMQSLVDKGLYGTPDLAVLEVPWENATTAELIARMEQDIGLAGNAFIWKAAPDLLVRLPPDEVTIVSAVVMDDFGRTYRKVIGYDWDPDAPTPPHFAPGTGLGRDDVAQAFTTEEIAHWSPYPDPAANFRGMSWLTPIMREVAADSGLTAYKDAFLDRAATPNIVVQYAQRLRRDTVDSIVDRLRERHGGIDNAYQALVLDQGATATTIGSTFEQMDYTLVQAAGASRICAAAGVDPVLLGLAPASGASGEYLPAMRRFADLTCRPLWRSMCAALQKFVPNVPPAGIRLWYDLSDIAALREGELQRAQASQVKAAALITMVQAGATLESAMSAVQADDIGMLKAAPTPPPVQQAPSGGQPGTPRAPTGATQAQTPASKLPKPSSFANLPSVNGTRH
jgi:phage portal protein BeeE